MSKRYGRNRKRRDRERIEELEYLLWDARVMLEQAKDPSGWHPRAWQWALDARIRHIDEVLAE